MAVIPTLRLLTTLECLGTYGGVVHFGVVVQVSAENLTVDASNSAFLQPWVWVTPSVQVWSTPASKNADGTWKPIDGTAVLTPVTSVTSVPLPDPNMKLDPRVLKNLGADFKDAEGHQDFDWISSVDKGTATTVQPGRQRYPWPAHLAQLARYPYPIPHLLQLSYIFSMPAADATAYLAAIKFTINGTTHSAVKGVTLNGSQLDIGYDNNAVPFMVTSSTVPCYFDLAALGESRIVTPAKSEAIDWQAHLVASVADLFDLGARILRPVRETTDRDLTPAQDATSDQKGVFATLKTRRDAIAKDFAGLCYNFLNAQQAMVGFGLNSGPDGSSLFTRVSQSWLKSRQDVAAGSAFITQLQSALTTAAATQRTSESWPKLLSTVPDFVGNSYVTTPPKTAIVADNLNDKLVPLEHIQQLFQQDDVLSRVVLAEWNTVDATTKASPLFQSFMNGATTAMENFDVRLTLLKGHLATSWSQISASVTNAADQRSALRAAIQAQLLAEFQAVCPSTATGDAMSMIATTLGPNDTWLQNRLSNIVPDSPAQTANVTTTASMATRVSQGISFLVDTLDSGATGVGGPVDANDTLRSMIGFCILIRNRTKSSQWYCLNAGIPMAPSWDDKPTTDSPVPAISGSTVPYVVASPQHVQDGLRHAIITYNNQPLMVSNPLHPLGDGLATQKSASGPRLIQFDHPSVSQDLAVTMSEWKIPGLIFGHTYEFVVGRISNSGGLPSSFATSNNPAVIDLAGLQARAGTLQVAAVQYLRTVPVGALRLSTNQKPPTLKDHLKLPPVPPDVRPRAGEVFPTKTPLANEGPAGSAEHASPPLVVLTASLDDNQHPLGAQSQTIYIYPPAIDLETWDRWVASTDSQDDRITVWSKFFTIARKDLNVAPSPLEDPAVTMLQVEVVIDDEVKQYFPQKGAAPIQKSWQAGTGGLSATQLKQSSEPIPFLMKTGTGSSFDTTTWTLTLAPGAVAQVILKPVVATGDAGTKRFVIPAVNKGFKFLVEAAREDMPTADDLHNAFTVGVNADNKALNFTLDTSKLGKYKSQVRSATLQTHVWRWDGRHIGHFDFSTLKSSPGYTTPPQALLDWENEAYANRSDIDASFRPMDLTNTDSTDVTKLQLVAKDDIGKNLGSLYYRSGVQIDSRYGSLVPLKSRSVNSLSRESALPGLDGGWVRTAVPVRLAADFTVPKPAIQFILPLTGALPSATAPKDVESTTGSALVVLQGPWYSIGGLAEDLQYEIVQPAATSDAGGYTIEAGPDPIVWHGTSATDTPSKTYDAHQGTMSSDDCLHGPVGHTFDTSDANPLFVNTSFVLDPPKPTGKSPMPWTFAEIRFKRVIANVPNVPTPGLQSEWTLPQWVQFFPGQFHGLLDGSAKVVDTSSYRVSTGEGTVSIVDGAGKPVSLYNVQTDNHLTFVLLLTRKVSDMLGRKGQERFLDVCVALSNPFDKNGKTKATWARGAVTGAMDADLVGRIMAIQLSPDAGANQKVKDANPPETAATPLPNFPPQTRDDLWAALFPASGDAFDAFARIVTISPPIASTSLPCANGGVQ